MLILAIETSCDETAAAILKDGIILSNIVFSQEKLHAKYGGIVPEVAARAHIEVIIPTIEKTLAQAKVKKENLDAIAVTCGPGLITSLMIGVDTAKTLAFVLKKPLVAVNHLEAHIYANFVGANSKFEIRNSKQISTSKIQNSKQQLTNIYKLQATSYRLFPLLCLIVSGGHTELVLMPKHLEYKLIGETRDDAAGEAFDKVAKLLDIGYPGGPIISKLAKNGNPKAYPFPRPMLKSGDFDFSFSGLKTDVLRLVKNHLYSKNGIADFSLRHLRELKLANPNMSLRFSQKEIRDICASFQAAVCDVLVSKTIAAAKKFRVKTVALAGGVAANKSLRQKMKEAVKKELPATSYQLPALKFCTDNAAMVGFAGYLKFKAGKKTSWQEIRVDANARL